MASAPTPRGPTDRHQPGARRGAPVLIGGTMGPFQAGPLRDRVLAYADHHHIGIAEALRRLIAAGLEHADRFSGRPAPHSPERATE